MATTTPTKKPQLTVSMVEMLFRCGLQFQRRYGVRFGVWHSEEVIPPGIALGVGIAVHKSVEANLRKKMETGRPLQAGEAETVAYDHLDNMFETAEMMFSDDEAADLKGTMGAALDQAVALSRLHYAQVAPSIDPVALEEPFVIELANYPIDLAGRKDIRVKDGSLRDTKTSGKTPAETDGWTPQMAMYSLSEKIERKALPPRVSLDFLIKTKTPKVVTLTTEKPTEAMIQPLLRRVERATEIIDAVKSGKQAFAPAQANDWVCTSRFCGFAQSCPFWSGR